MLIDELRDIPYFRMNSYPAVGLGVVLAEGIKGDQRALSRRLALVRHDCEFLYVTHCE